MSPQGTPVVGCGEMYKVVVKFFCKGHKQERLVGVVEYTDCQLIVERMSVQVSCAGQGKTLKNVCCLQPHVPTVTMW